MKIELQSLNWGLNAAFEIFILVSICLLFPLRSADLMNFFIDFGKVTGLGNMTNRKVPLKQTES